MNGPHTRLPAGQRRAYVPSIAVTYGRTPWSASPFPSAPTGNRRPRRSASLPHLDGARTGTSAPTRLHASRRSSATSRARPPNCTRCAWAGGRGGRERGADGAPRHPRGLRDDVAASWREQGALALRPLRSSPTTATGPAKLLEYNADTPTSIYETGTFQWIWLEDMIARRRAARRRRPVQQPAREAGARFRAIFPGGGFALRPATRTRSRTADGRSTWQDIAKEAGLEPKFVPIEDIGLDADGRFADEDNCIISALFKLYPWEEMLARALRAEDRRLEDPVPGAGVEGGAVQQGHAAAAVGAPRGPPEPAAGVLRGRGRPGARPSMRAQGGRSPAAG